MTFKRCFKLLIALLILTIGAGITIGNTVFFYMAAFVLWMLCVWFALALFKGSKGPELNGI